jgi:hypothetical protein
MSSKKSVGRASRLGVRHVPARPGSTSRVPPGGDAIDLDIERPWMRGDIHEHAGGRILRKEFRIDAVDGGEHLHRCAISMQSFNCSSTNSVWRSIGALTISPVAGSNGGRPDADRRRAAAAD